MGVAFLAFGTVFLFSTVWSDDVPVGIEVFLPDQSTPEPLDFSKYFNIEDSPYSQRGSLRVSNKLFL